MEQYLAEQYLARIGYVSSPGQKVPEPDPRPRPDIRLATTEEVQAEIPGQIDERYAAQYQPFSISLSKSALQNDGQKFPNDTPLPSTLPYTSYPSPVPATEASYPTMEPRYGHNFPSSPALAPYPTKTQILTVPRSELERRQKISLAIERQLHACRRKLHILPSAQRKIKYEQEKRIANFEKRASNETTHNKTQTSVDDAQKRNAAQTAEEAEMEEMTDIYRQYDRGSVGMPNADSVGAFFSIIAGTEHRLKKAEGAIKAAERREVELEDRLERARWAVFEMEDVIEGVENGVFETEDVIEGVENGVFEMEILKPKVEKRVQWGGKRKQKCRKWARDKKQGDGEGGDKRAGRRGKKEAKGYLAMLGG